MGESENDESYVGLFGAVDHAYIESVNLESARIRGYRYVGGIAGFAGDGTTLKDINVNKNVTNSSTCNPDQYCVWARWGQFGGGVVGYLNGNSTLDNVHTSGPVKGSGVDIGGVAGHIDTASVTNSSSSSRVDGGIYIGGFVGSIWLSTVDSSYATGNVYAEHDDTGKPGTSSGGFAGSLYAVRVTNSYATGNVTGADGMGGFAGSIGCSSELTNIYTTGNVNGNNNVGGIAGEDACEGGGSSITSAYSTGSITGASSVGGILGIGYGTTVYSSYAEGNLSASQNVGGLIGTSNSAIITRSFFHLGTINASAQESNAGGLIGMSYGNSQVTDSYAEVNITGIQYIGGLIGHAGEVHIQNSYATGHIESSDSVLGGIIGSVEAGSISKVFATVSISSSNPTNPIGGLHGSAVNTDIDGYIDGQIQGCYGATSVESTGTINCVTVNEDGNDPAYFKYTNQNQPLTDWDFETTWRTVAGGYPCLQWSNVSCGLSQTDSDGDGSYNSIENAGPNNGDANDDGVPDSSQANVVTFFNTVTDNYSVITTNCTSISNVQIGAEPDGESADPSYVYPGGLTGFRIICPHDGDTATIHQYYYGINGHEGFKVRKYINGHYVDIPGSQPLGQPVGDQVVFLAEYQITDGGEYDDDGEANGIITDPSGVAMSNDLYNSLYGSGGGNNSSSSSNATSNGGSLASTGDKIGAYTLLSLIIISSSITLLGITRKFSHIDQK